MEFWEETMKQLYDIVWKINQQKVCEEDMKTALDLITEADEEPWIPVALQYNYCKMVVLEYIQFHKHFMESDDSRADWTRFTKRNFHCW